MLVLIWRNLFRRPLRSVLTMLAMALAVGATVALVGIADGIQLSVRQIYESAAIDIVVLRAGVQERLNSVLDERLAEQIGEIPEVQLVVPSLMDVIRFEQRPLLSVPLRGMPPGTPLVETFVTLGGRPLRPGDGRDAILGKTLAETLDKRVGDTIRLYDQEDFRVIGVFSAASVFDNGSLIIPLAELQRLMGREHHVTGFALRVKDPSDAPAIERAIRSIEELRDGQGKSLGLRALSARDHVTSITQVRLAQGMSWGTSAIALFIGVIGVLNTTYISVFERTKEIGVLRAIGWRPRRIAALVIGEALALSVLGAVVGSFGAVALVRGLAKMPAVSGAIAGEIPWPVLGQGLVLAAVVGVLAALYPTYRSLRISPTVALRSE